MYACICDPIDRACPDAWAFGRRSVSIGCGDQSIGRPPFLLSLRTYTTVSLSHTTSTPTTAPHLLLHTQHITAPSFGDKLKAGLAKVAAPAVVGASAFVAPSISHALTKDELSSLSYLQVKGTGLANRCPEVRACVRVCVCVCVCGGGGGRLGWYGGMVGISLSCAPRYPHSLYYNTNRWWARAASTCRAARRTSCRRSASSPRPGRCVTTAFCPCVEY